jgi:hypothetical protein
MKRLILSSLAALALLATPQVRAWNYNQGDLLLVFRNGSQDVEFDIGSVTNLLGHTNGYTTTITGWDPNLVNTTFGGFSGLEVALIATSGTTNWLSGAEPDTTAYNISSQAAQSLNSLIAGVGSKPIIPLAIPTAETNAYSIDVTGQYKRSSYDYVVSGGQYNGIPQLGGHAQFTVEQSIPGLLDFWSVSSTTVYPNSPPDKLLGTFNITAGGVLTCTAGPRAATVLNVTHASGVSAIQFSTTVGNIYSVSYTNVLGGAKTTWPVDATTLTGDGRADTLYHTNSSAAEFYTIQTQ